MTLKEPKAWIELQKQRLSVQKDRILLCFFAVFIFGMIAHAYAFFNSDLSHDALTAFVATNIEEIWKIELGRYLVPVYRFLFRGSVALPWVIGLLGLLWTAIAVCLVVKLFDIRQKWMVVLTAGIMVTNITYISQIATYIYEFDFNALSLLLSVWAVYVWRKNSKFSCVTAGFLLMLSLGIYQSYITVTITLILCLCLGDLFEQKEIKGILVAGIKGLLLVVLGVALYLVLGFAVHRITGIALEPRTNALAGFESGNLLVQYIRLIIPGLIKYGVCLLHPAYPLGACAVLVLVNVCALGALAIRTFIKKRFSFGRILLICLLIALLPFAMVGIYFVTKGEGVHDLMVYAVCLTYFMSMYFSFLLAKQEEGTFTPFIGRAAKLVSCILVVFILGQNILLANTAYIKKEQEAEATLSTMTRVVALMEQQEGYAAGETTVAFIGRGDTYTDMPGFEKVSNITGLGDNSSITYYKTYKSYFAYVLNYPVSLCDEQTNEQLCEDPRVKQMPAFPDRNCIEMIDGIMVVKMAETSDKALASRLPRDLAAAFDIFGEFLFKGALPDRLS